MAQAAPAVAAVVAEFPPRDRLIAQLTEPYACAANIDGWAFVALQALAVTLDSDAPGVVAGTHYAGTVVRQTVPYYDYRTAVQLDAWCFAMERPFASASAFARVALPPHRWFIVGFYGHCYFVFRAIEHADPEQLRAMFLDYVVNTFWPILRPEPLAAALVCALRAPHASGAPIAIRWHLAPLAYADHDRLVSAHHFLVHRRQADEAHTNDVLGAAADYPDAGDCDCDCDATDAATPPRRRPPK